MLETATVVDAWTFIIRISCVSHKTFCGRYVHFFVIVIVSTGYHAGYQYNHDVEPIDQVYLPSQLLGTNFFKAVWLALSVVEFWQLGLLGFLFQPGSEWLWFRLPSSTWKRMTDCIFFLLFQFFQVDYVLFAEAVTVCLLIFVNKRRDRLWLSADLSTLLLTLYGHAHCSTARSITYLLVQ